MNIKSRFSIQALARFLGIWPLALVAQISAGQSVTTPDTSPPNNDDNKNTLHFITIDVPPWAAVNSDSGRQEGAFVEIVAALEALTGFRIITTLTPFARVDRELESGEHDCTILVPRDQSIVKHGETVALHDVGILSHRAAPIGEYEDLHGKTVSLLRGSAISPRFDADTEITRTYDTDYSIALRKLARQRVDGIAGAIPTLRYLAIKNGDEELLAPALKLTEIPLKFQCSLRSDHLNIMPEFNAAIRKLRDSGRLGEILALYHF